MAGLSAYYQKHRKSDQSEAERFADALRAVYLPAVEAELDKIRALDAPDGDEADIDAILDAEQRAVEAVAKLNGVPEGRFKVEEHFVDAAKLARAYGIPACANSNPRPG